MDVALQIYCIRQKLARLPSYGISPKKIRGKTYYYRQITENGIRKQILIHKDEDLNKILSVYYLRQKLKKCLHNLLLKMNREIRLKLRFYEKYGVLLEKEPPDRMHQNRSSEGRYLVSKSELALESFFHSLGLKICYEEKEIIGYLPDFIFHLGKRLVYHEHMGMLEDPAYREKQLKKIRSYRKHGIEYGKNLFITRDLYDKRTQTGSIDLLEILWRMAVMNLLNAKQLRKLSR